MHSFLHADTAYIHTVIKMTRESEPLPLLIMHLAFPNDE